MNPVDQRADPAAPFLGAGWAIGIASALIVAFAILVALRWQKPSVGTVDQIVQISMQVVAPTPTPAAEVLAPDPGDNP